MDGIDAGKVSDWLVANVERVAAPFEFTFIPGGRSNLTFKVTDARGRRMVLRRPPISHTLATAHDMSREHRIISALHDTPVPVPDALGYCADESVNGLPFYVMDFVDGHVPRDAAETQTLLDEAARCAAGNNLVDVLVALHSVDVDDVGLGDLGRREGYIARQLKRWYGQFQHSQDQEKRAGVHRRVPQVEQVHAMLCERVPTQRGTAIVHGDYRLDNTIIDASGMIKAVLDWELCTLGDPLADLGILMIYWADRDDPEAAATAGGAWSATSLAGFPTRYEVAERYADRSGREVTELDFYVAFGHWKLACIMEGVYARYAAGAMGSGESDIDAFAKQVVHRAELARAAIGG